MGFGIIEPAVALGQHVPGTATLFNDPSDTAHQHALNSLKYGHGRSSDVILVPQPSDSPNDPLNWPRWKKELTYFSICFSVAIGGALGPLLAPVTGVLAEGFGVSIEKASLAAGYPLLAAGCMAWVSQIWAPIFGKRSNYIFSSLIFVATCIWITQVRSFGEFLAARTVQGLGSGAFESIVISSIGDLYFIHERGKRIVAYNIVTLGVAQLAPIAGGYISQQYGWRMQFYILIAFSSVALLLVLLACPEHGNYHRPQVYETDITASLLVDDNNDGSEDGSKVQTSEKVVEATSPTSQSPERRRTYWQELNPFSGFDKHQNPLVLAARPFVCMLYPAVFWGFTVGGLWSAWTVGLSIVAAQIFGAPPNIFDPTRLGYLFTFPLVFIILGCIVGFLLSDWYPKWAARRNGGIFEPEFRLVLLISVLLVGIPGLFGFGYYAAQKHDTWQAASALQGLIAFASILAASVSFSYVLDCHRARSVEVSVAIIMLRNFFWFGSSYFLPDWFAKAPTYVVLDVVGGLQLALTLTSILVYVYGKVLRQFISRHDPLRAFGLA